MTSPCRKSKSTGSSSTSTWSRRRWRIRNLLTRSRSDGKETLEFLNTSPVDNIDKSCSSSPCPKNKETVKTKSKKKEKEKISVSAHEKFYLRNKAMKEEDKRKSYLSYKQEFVGLFSNIHRHGKVSSPFWSDPWQQLEFCLFVLLFVCLLSSKIIVLTKRCEFTFVI